MKPKFIEEVNTVIPSQAGNWNNDRCHFPEGVETRGVRIQNDNPLLERSRACVQQVQDIVRPLRKQGTRQSTELAKEAPEIGLNNIGPLSVRIERQIGVNCWNAKADSGYANQQPSRPNGKNVGRKVHRLGVEEPTNKTPLAPRILPQKDEDIVEAAGKPVEQPAKRSTRTLQPQQASRRTLVGTYGYVADTVTLAALLHTLVNLSVFRGIGMAVRAMGLSSLPGTVSAHIGPAFVLSGSDSLNVIGTHTSAIAAEVIRLVSIGQWSIGPLINPMVRSLVGSCAIGTTSNPKSAVATCVDRGRPNPTRPQFGSILREWPILVDLAPKAVFYWDSLSKWCASWHSDHIIPSCRNKVNNHFVCR